MIEYKARYGVRVTRKRIGAWLAVLGVAACLGYWLMLEPAPRPQISDRPISVEHDSQAAQPEARFGALPKRETFGNERGQLFPALRTARAAAGPATTASAATPEQPAAPQMPYRVAGTVSYNGVVEIVLGKGNRVYPVHEGEELGDGYRVESISMDQVTLLYVPLGLRQNLSVPSTLEGGTAPARPAAADKPEPAPAPRLRSAALGRGADRARRKSSQRR